MSPKVDGRTATFDRSQAQTRLAHAQKFLDVADLVSPGGLQSAKYLDRLLDLKDTAHYGVINVSGAELRSALRRARTLVEFANGSLRR